MCKSFNQAAENTQSNGFSAFHRLQTLFAFKATHIHSNAGVITGTDITFTATVVADGG